MRKENCSHHMGERPAMQYMHIPRTPHILTSDVSIVTAVSCLSVTPAGHEREETLQPTGCLHIQCGCGKVISLQNRRTHKASRAKLLAAGSLGELHKGLDASPMQEGVAVLCQYPSLRLQPLLHNFVQPLGANPCVAIQELQTGRPTGVFQWPDKDKKRTRPARTRLCGLLTWVSPFTRSLRRASISSAFSTLVSGLEKLMFQP